MSLRPLFLAAPTVLVAAASLAWLTPATAFDGGLDGAQVAQANPPAAPAQPPAAGGPEKARERPPFSPQKMCVEHLARRIGNRAYLKARLDLKPEQMNAWNAFEKAADEASVKEKAYCASLPVEIKPPSNFADRFSLQADRMKARAATLEAVKPSLLALYAALTPEQKELLDRPMMGGRGMHRRG